MRRLPGIGRAGGPGIAVIGQAKGQPLPPSLKKDGPGMNRIGFPFLSDSRISRNSKESN
jgi:hypothetical protein